MCLHSVLSGAPTSREWGLLVNGPECSVGYKQHWYSALTSSWCRKSTGMRLQCLLACSRICLNLIAVAYRSVCQRSRMAPLVECWWCRASDELQTS